MIDQILIQNGFSEREAKVYVAALELGEAPLSRVASKARLQRSTVYSLVESLKRRGLVSLAKRGGVQYLAALPPRVLVDRFKQSADLAAQALPQMLELAYSSPSKPRIRFYDGMGGLKEILKEFSYSKVPSMVFTDYEQMPKELFQFIRTTVVSQRRKLDVFTHLIVPENDVNARIRKEDMEDLHFAEHRLVRFPRKRNPIEILLFESSKIGLLSFTTSELFGLVIDSEAIYETLRNVFELIWNNAAPR